MAEQHIQTSEKTAAKITCLTPCGGAVRLSIAPSPGGGNASPTPSPGAIEGCFCYLSTPPDGDHLEKPSVAEFGAASQTKAGVLKVVEQITCLRPPHGTESLLIAPPHGTGRDSVVPPHGTISPLFAALPVPPHGHHLEKPSVASFDGAVQAKKSGAGMLGLNKKQQALFTRVATSCYIAPVMPVMRDRDWSPVESLRRKPQFPQWSAALSFVPLYGGSTCKRKLGRFVQAVPGRPTRRVTALIGLSAVVFEPNCLEAIMATSLCATAPTSSASGTPDPIQLHAQAHNALSMALHYLSQPNANVAGARRKATQALSALRGLDLSLEG